MINSMNRTDASSAHRGTVGAIGATALGVLLTMSAPGIAQADELCPKRGGIFRTVDLSYKSIDPSQRANPAYFMHLIYDTLLDINYDLSLSPGLAEAMPVKDGNSYTFKLRKGVKFHDGTDFNAAAVKFNAERLAEGKVKSPISGIWRKSLQSVTAVDDHTVRFETKGDWPTFVWDAASSLRFASPTAVKSMGKDYGLKGAVGTGPFVFESFKPKQTLVLNRNPNYYQTGLPCLDGFRTRVIKSGSVRILTLKKGELDVINTFPESQFPQFDGSDIIIDEGKASTLTVLPLNTKHPALNDKRVRQAIQYAVNGKELIDNVYKGAGEEITSLFPSWHPAYTPTEDLTPIRQDIAKAKALLAEAGYGEGGKTLKLTLETGSGGAHIQRGVLIQAQLRAVGIDLQVKNISMGQALSNMRSGKHDMILWQMLGGPTIKDYIWNMYGAGGSNNNAYYNKKGGYQNPRAEELANEIAKSNDPAAVRGQIAELQKIIFDDVPIIFLNYRNHRTARHDYVKNFRTAKLKGMEDLRRVWLDK